VANESASTIITTLRQQGVRITSARRAVIAALVRTDGHVTAEDIATAVQLDNPEIHLSTVYRTLESLEELGVVDHVHLGHGSAVYHLAANRHQHLVCENCKKVIHLPHGVVDKLAVRSTRATTSPCGPITSRSSACVRTAEAPQTDSVHV
jgi:Fe2+ or Zn2+ uptake regulation protein